MNGKNKKSRKVHKPLLVLEVLIPISIAMLICYINGIFDEDLKTRIVVITVDTIGMLITWLILRMGIIALKLFIKNTKKNGEDENGG